MGLLEEVRQRAAGARRHVVLPEGRDPRTVRAAGYLRENDLCRVTLLGKRSAVEEAAAEAGLALKNREIVDPADSEWGDEFGRELYQLRKARGISPSEAAELARSELYFAAFMIRSGRCDASVGGACNTTGDVIRAGLHVLGMAPGMEVVSSSFLILLPDGRPFTFGDCAIVPDPDPRQLASIAAASAATHAALTGLDPRVALLSFSTLGSAEHPKAEAVREALRILRKTAPELAVEGELQLDAAIVPEVSRLKSPGSRVAGEANVLIFPDLNSGNIGYKLAQRLGGAEAIGPLVQGLAAPFMDLSRGCHWMDIVNVASIACVMVR